jgi:hypothetical protein
MGTNDAQRHSLDGVHFQDFGPGSHQEIDAKRFENINEIGSIHVLDLKKRHPTPNGPITNSAAGIR